jgi:hypothetical protein
MALRGDVLSGTKRGVQDASKPKVDRALAEPSIQRQSDEV